jgi:hypothetical protein
MTLREIAKRAGIKVAVEEPNKGKTAMRVRGPKAAKGGKEKRARS